MIAEIRDSFKAGEIPVSESIIVPFDISQIPQSIAV